MYKSCDNIGCISQLTRSFVETINPNSLNQLIPHGVNTDIFFKQDSETITTNRKLLLGKNYDFVLLCNNANIPRKQFGLLIQGFTQFYNQLSISEKSGVCLLIHTNVKSARGFNLNKLLDDLYPDIPILISDGKVSEKTLNNIYNLSHCTINVASNEGFGLTTLESVATQTPVIMSYTGGLKDQYHKKWCEKIKPDIRLIMGSQKTPYIYSDICSPDSISKSISKMYNRIDNISMSDVDKFLDKKEFTSNKMCESLSKEIEITISNFRKKEPYRFTKIL